MATQAQVSALLRAYAKGDDDKFVAVAAQIAAHAESKGCRRFADEVRQIMGSRREKTSWATPVSQIQGQLENLLIVETPRHRLEDMELSDELRASLANVILEQQHRGELREKGLAPIRKLLLTGPPGTGKTMTAHVLANELELPLYSVCLDALIGSLLGETAAKLRKVFNFIKSSRGVYLFDEFDALGANRGSDKHDVGEMRRVVNSLLKFMEECSGDSIVVCATNHEAILDCALYRRFDANLFYNLPSEETKTKLIKSHLKEWLDPESVCWDKALSVPPLSYLSHADVVSACYKIAKKAIINGFEEISGDAVIKELACQGRASSYAAMLMYKSE